MVKVRPFAALRPPREIVQEVAARPYDVMNSAEAAAEAGEKSLLHITRPEIDFNPIAGEHEDRSYRKAVDNFCTWQERKWLVQDPKPQYYIYAQRMGERTQYGFVLCAYTGDYFSGVIKKHELTRKDKEDDRMKHVLIQNANIEPVFFSFKDNDILAGIISRISAGAPEYDFVAPDDGFGHKLWVISDDADIKLITETFASIPAFYVADGHHRTAAAARVGEFKASKNPAHTGEEEYNYFMAVCFPESQLRIMDYNRVVRDLNGYSAAQLLAALEQDFEVVRIAAAGAEAVAGADGGAAASGADGDTVAAGASGADGKSVADVDGVVAPTGLHNFSMYLEGEWYSLTARAGRYDDSDPIGVLDVTILSNLVLDKLLGIKDLRTDKRIDFVGGIRGLGELKRRVDSGEMAVAFALYPVSMQQLTDIADSGNIMPPKTTWFEPKLRSGLTIHLLDDQPV